MTPANDTPTPFGAALFETMRANAGASCKQLEAALTATVRNHPLARSAEPSASERPGRKEGAVISHAAPSNYQKEAAR